MGRRSRPADGATGTCHFCVYCQETQSREAILTILTQDVSWAASTRAQVPLLLSHEGSQHSSCWGPAGPSPAHFLLEGVSTETLAWRALTPSTEQSKRLPEHSLLPQNGHPLTLPASVCVLICVSVWCVCVSMCRNQQCCSGTRVVDKLSFRLQCFREVGRTAGPCWPPMNVPYSVQIQRTGMPAHGPGLLLLLH